MWKLLILTTLFLIVMWSLYHYKLRFGVDKKPERKLTWKNLLILLGVAFLVKMFWGGLVSGHPTDIACFKYWSQMVYEKGIGQFYYLDAFTDYPPGYMYILYGVAAIRHLFGISVEANLSILLLKMIPILCDLAAGAFIYKIAAGKCKQSIALLLAFIYVFNPAIILNSSVWGQVDAVYTLCIIATYYLCMEKKRIPAYFIFAMGVLIKPQMLVFTPVLLFTIVDQVFLQEFSWKKFFVELGSGLVAIGLMFALAAPFGLDKVLPQYVETVKSYPYASVNAYNFWTLLGKNWQPQTDHFLWFTCNQLGTIVILASVVLGGIIFFQKKYRKEDAKERYFLSAAVTMMTVFCFAPRMHERYVFPVIALLLIAYCIRPKKEYFITATIVSALHFLNAADVLNNSFVENASTFSVFQSLISLCTVLVYVYFMWKCFSREKKFQWKHMILKDVTILGSIMLVYGAFALYDLGKQSAPETNYDITQSPSTIIIDLGKESNVSHIYAYLGHLESRNFLLETGNDLNKMDVEGNIRFDSVFQWNDGLVTPEGDTTGTGVALDTGKMYRYIRLSAQDMEAVLNEIVIVDSDGKRITPTNSEQSKTLFDEQDLFPKEITFREGTYFDEIYHARTAYESIHNEYCYENTHPPLGKEIISIGIRIFGMNPFGWRIMGTLFGILMLPFIYLFAKKLTKKYWVAGVTTALFAFDFMHFTQTRIATIDVFGTFFILAMFYYMYCYVSKDFFEGPVYKNWLPLGLAGVSMGLGIASKWTAVYAAAGMGIVFFAAMIYRFVEYRKQMKKGKERQRVVSYPQRLLSTLGICVVFFIIVPGTIYILSYLGFNDGSGHGLIRQMLDNQRSMFEYHSSLEATHPYSSWWYQWPTMARPVFYYCHTLANGLREGISAFGNPLVWWASVPAAVYMLYLIMRYRDKKAIFLLFAYLAQYVPWMLVTRITFAYHYFPSVVFATLMIGYTMDDIVGDKKKRIPYMIGYAIAAGLIFLMFYPILSGQPVVFEYVEKALRWMKGWVLCL